MRRVTSLLLASVITLSGVTALAAQKDIYQDAENSIKSSDAVEDNTFTTVKIVNKDGDIVYLNQDSSGFNAATSFMMKEGIDDGTYTATFANENGKTDSVDFVVGKFKITGSKYKDDKDVGTINLDTAQKMGVVIPAKKQSETEVNREEYDINADLYTKGFTFTLADAQDYVYFVSGDASTCYGYYPLPEPKTDKAEETAITGESSIFYALQIWNIPEDRTDMNLYLGGAPEHE